MHLYARPSARLVRQVVSDVLMVLWALGWWFVGRFTDGVVRAIAEPAREGAALGDQVRGQLDEVARQAGTVPVVGEGLSRPFGDLARTVGDYAATAREHVAAIELAATVAGWLAFLVPTAALLSLWLPRRLAFAARAREVAALVASSDGTDLLALRALATRPIAELRTVASDPVAAWRAGDLEVTARLAELELVAAGVERPRRRVRT